MQADHNVDDLKVSSRNFKAENGGRGQGSDMHGRKGEHLRIRVPCGTIVHQLGERSISRSSAMQPAESEQILLGEVLNHGDEILVANGGVGGRGNAAFYTPEM